LSGEFGGGLRSRGGFIGFMDSAESTGKPRQVFQDVLDRLGDGCVAPGAPDAGVAIDGVGDGYGEPRKLRDLHFDALIALTARARGARLITSNRDGFELIRGYRDFRLEVW
jgi:hypothetical protein